MRLTRCPANPIIRPGGLAWRSVAVFNPGAIADNGKVFLYERAAGSLRPFQTSIGLLESDDGVEFRPVLDHPVLTGEMVGYPEGSVQDARVVKIDGRYYLTYALQRYWFDAWPNGRGPADYSTNGYGATIADAMVTRSGIAVSDDLRSFRQLGFTTPAEIDDRNTVLFPERINGRFALLRRPITTYANQDGADRPGISISYSHDLLEWSEPRPIARPEQAWEALKIGAATTPVRTQAGWLVLYHGVDDRSVYRVGAMLLDLANVEEVVARTATFIMEPETYYEKVGLVVPNVVFPTGSIVRDRELYVYYGCADTAIGLATVRLEELVDHILKTGS